MYIIYNNLLLTLTFENFRQCRQELKSQQPHASDVEIEKLCEEIFPNWLKNNVSILIKLIYILCQLVTLKILLISFKSLFLMKLTIMLGGIPM